MWLVFGLVVLVSSPQLYGKVPRLIPKNTNRLAQAVVFFRRHFLCGALLWNCSSAERECLSKRTYNGNVQKNPLSAASCITKGLPIAPRFSPTIFYRDAISALLSTPLNSSRLYAQNPVFGIAHQERVRVHDTSSCENSLIDGCICAARVRAQNI